MENKIFICFQLLTSKASALKQKSCMGWVGNRTCYSWKQYLMFVHVCGEGDQSFQEVLKRSTVQWNIKTQWTMRAEDWNKEIKVILRSNLDLLPSFVNANKEEKTWVRSKWSSSLDSKRDEKSISGKAFTAFLLSKVTEACWICERQLTRAWEGYFLRDHNYVLWKHCLNHSFNLLICFID